MNVPSYRGLYRFETFESVGLCARINNGLVTQVSSEFKTILYTLLTNNGTKMFLQPGHMQIGIVIY